VFTLHGVDTAGQPVLRLNLRRTQMISFFKERPPTEIAMEACAGSHHWARKLSALGHDVRLLPPQYVKPFVKRAKNDRNDAAAIEAKAMLALLGQEIEHLDARLKEIETKLIAMHRTHAISQLLATIPGIGPIIALTLAIEVDPKAFQSGRHLAAWIGLTPKEHSTGGKQRLGGISRAGHERLRQLLVTGATAVIRLAARPGNKLATDWLLKLLQRRPRKLAAVALANKMARIAWAMMMSGEVYRHQPFAAGAVSA
jgi:transposase